MWKAKGDVQPPGLNNYWILRPICWATTAILVLAGPQLVSRSNRSHIFVLLSVLFLKRTLANIVVPLPSRSIGVCRGMCELHACTQMYERPLAVES